MCARFARREGELQIPSHPITPTPETSSAAKTSPMLPTRSTTRSASKSIDIDCDCHALGGCELQNEAVAIRRISDVGAHRLSRSDQSTTVRIHELHYRPITVRSGVLQRALAAPDHISAQSDHGGCAQPDTCLDLPSRQPVLGEPGSVRVVDCRPAEQSYWNVRVV